MPINRCCEVPLQRDCSDENATASVFPVATRLELVDKSCCGVSERTTIKWNHFLTFRRFPAATRPELVDRSCCRELQSWHRVNSTEPKTIGLTQRVIYHCVFIRARCAPLSPASGFPVYSRSLRSAQSRKRVPSFASLIFHSEGRLAVDYCIRVSMLLCRFLACNNRRSISCGCCIIK
jgi:hypothetical protein